MFQRFLTILLLTASVCTTANAQKVKEPKLRDSNWIKPYQPFRIAGNLYYVGSYDLASYLITTSEGNILINTGVASSGKQIKKNIQTLGFKFSDIKILLTTQAHYDHMGAMAWIKKKTGAQLMVNEKEKAVLLDGGRSDYALGGPVSFYKPVSPDRLLKNGDTIRLGNMQLVMLHHPGHTKGSCSYIFTVKDEKRSWKVLIANMPTIVLEKPFAEAKDYPEVVPDYAYTLSSLKNTSFDIWVASHASQFDMHIKHKPGDAYNPAAFADRAGFDASLKDLQKDYDKKVGK